MGQRQDHGEGEDLEAAEEHDESEKHPRLPVGQREQGGRDPAEEDERHAVDCRVLDYARQADDQRRRVAEPVEHDCVEERRSSERYARRDVIQEKPHRDGGRAQEPGDEALAGDAGPGTEQSPAERTVPHEEVDEHAARRERVGDKDRPPSERGDDRMSPPRQDGKESNLEGHERDEHQQQPTRLALRRHDEVGDQYAEEREDHAVEHGVLGDQPRRDDDSRRVAHTLERRCAEHGRRAERLPSRRVVDEEPGGDDGRADEAGDDAVAEIPGPGVHVRPPLQSVGPRSCESLVPVYHHRKRRATGACPDGLRGLGREAHDHLAQIVA